MIRDHWTAWIPPDPATYPPNSRTHSIVQGETLSGIARSEYGNAYLWPQIWEMNTWIKDAHWIYPGDVLLLQGEASQAGVGTQTTTGGAAGTATGTGTGTGVAGGQTGTGAGSQQPGSNIPGAITAAEVHRENPPIPLGAEADVYCYGYIGDPNESMPNTIIGFEDVEVRRMPEKATWKRDEAVAGSTGDLIYVNGGTSTGLVAGETYMVIEPGDMITHPHTGEVMGRHYDFQGQVKILCADATHSRAIITQNCREVHVGARLKPLPQIPIPIARVPDVPGFCDPYTGRNVGYIIDSQDWELALAEGNLVQVDLGSDNQIQPGDFLTVFRDTPGQPRQILGEIGILTTQRRTATGKIVAVRRAMAIGDQVEAR